MENVWTAILCSFKFALSYIMPLFLVQFHNFIGIGFFWNQATYMLFEYPTLANEKIQAKKKKKTFRCLSEDNKQMPLDILKPVGGVYPFERFRSTLIFSAKSFL